MMNVAYYTGYLDRLRNRMFDLNSECNVDDVLDRWVALKEFLAEREININTYDMYKHFKEVTFWLMQDPAPDMFRFMLRNRINPRKAMLFLHEPPVVNPWGWKYLRYYPWLFRAILTWHTELCQRHKKFFHYHFPQKFDKSKYPYYKSKGEKNLCVMIHSNKSSKVPGELYSLRREIIRYFEKRGDGLLDLYGYGWNTEECHMLFGSPSPFFTTLYKGTIPDKKETFSEYYFTFCIDNCVVPGYVTYDPLISMSTGTVPIYLPMPDALEYIPENTFINYNDFKTLDELVLYLKSVVNTSNKYEEYRHNGWEFLNSAHYYPFTVEKFCEDVYQAIR